MAEPSPPAPRIHPAAVQRHLARRMRASADAPWLHTEIARRMADRLDVIRTRPTTILDWWSTLGGSAPLLQDRYTDARITAVEPAAVLPMLPVSKTAWWQRWTGARKAMPRVADDAPLPQAGLLWANMMLHWVDALPPLLQQWHQALATDGFLMFSCFGPDTLRELHGLYADMGWPAPSSPFVDMHDIGDALVHAGFADPVMDMELLTLTWDSADGLLRELRGLGGNTTPGQPPGLRGRRWHQTLVQALHRQLDDGQGRLRLTFEVIYGHAFKPPPRVKAAEHTEISLDSMRQMIRQRGKSPGAQDV